MKLVLTSQTPGTGLQDLGCLNHTLGTAVWIILLNATTSHPLRSKFQSLALPHLLPPQPSTLPQDSKPAGHPHAALRPLFFLLTLPIAQWSLPPPDSHPLHDQMSSESWGTLDSLCLVSFAYIFSLEYKLQNGTLTGVAQLVGHHPQGEGSPVWFPVRAHAWVSGLVPGCGVVRVHNERQAIDVSLSRGCFSPSLSPSLPLSLKINKIFKKYIVTYAF